MRSLRAGIGIATLFSIFSKCIGYVDQLLVAMYFGIIRGLDIYFMAYGIAQLIVFSFSNLFDQVAVPHLVQARENSGEEAQRELAGTIVLFSCLIGVVLSVLFVLLFRVGAWLMAEGFSATDRVALHRMGLFFIPWVAVIFPYTGMSTVLRSLRYFDLVMIGDLIVAVVSTSVFFFWHVEPAVLALTLACGYAVGLLFFAFCGWKHLRLPRSLKTSRITAMSRNFTELFSVNQIGSLSTIVDRFIQSHLQAGSISCFNYTASTLGPINDLVLFKEFYIVSLSSKDQQEKKFQRLLTGILLLTVPMAIFLATHAQDLIQILYQHGHFKDTARTETARVFALYSATLVSGTFGAPFFRLFQIKDRIRYSGVVYLFSALCLGLLGLLFVSNLHMDVMGFALALVLDTYLMIILHGYFSARAGLKLNWLHLGRVLGYSLGTGVLTAWIAHRAPFLESVYLNFALQALIVGTLTAALYWPIRSTLRDVLYE